MSVHQILQNWKYSNHNLSSDASNIWRCSNELITSYWVIPSC